MLGRSGGEGVTLDSLWIIRGKESNYLAINIIPKKGKRMPFPSK